MNKSDYDKYYKKGGTYVIPVEVFNDLCDELERQISNYEQALEDLDKKENIIKEVREYIKNHTITNMEWWIIGEQKIECKFMKDANPQELLEILDKENI